MEYLEIKLEPEPLLIMDGVVLPVKRRQSLGNALSEKNSLGMDPWSSPDVPRRWISRQVFEIVLRLAIAHSANTPAVLPFEQWPHARDGTSGQHACDSLQKVFPQFPGCPVRIAANQGKPGVQLFYKHKLTLPPIAECDRWLNRSGICDSVLKDLKTLTACSKLSMIAAEGAVAATLVDEVLKLDRQLELRLYVSSSQDPHYEMARAEAHRNCERIVQAVTTAGSSAVSLWVIDHDLIPIVHGIGLHRPNGELEVAEVGIAGYDRSGQLTCWATKTPFERGPGPLSNFSNHLQMMERCGSARKVPR